MHAVIRTGGKQYYVTAGDILEVEKLAGEVGEIITIDDILMIANDADVTVGQPTVAEAAITARITGQYRGTKIMVFRYRPKKRIRVRKGHRQYITRLEIQSIKLGEHEFTVPAPAARQTPAIVEPTVVPAVAEEPQVVTVPETDSPEMDAPETDTVVAEQPEAPAAEDTAVDAPAADAGDARAKDQ
jgi:large subunit ribosomal protein L21